MSTCMDMAHLMLKPRGRQHRYGSFNVDACGQDSRFSYKGVFRLRTNLDGI
jgi:hypothetical protein